VGRPFSDLSSRSLPLRLVIEATPANALATDSQALCDQITCLLVSLVGEPFGQLDRSLLATLMYRGAQALGLMPSDLRAGG
jgi:mRNA-degrading endonuclease toxin of MazEF toxin-antitoxin module